jgi:nucleoid DNA-binding protein
MPCISSSMPLAQDLGILSAGGPRWRIHIWREIQAMAKTKAKAKAATKTKTTAKPQGRSASKPRTKTQIFDDIASATDLTRSEVAAVFTAMSDLMKKDLGSRGPGEFAVPGLMKILRVSKPSRPARKNVPNPFRPGELMDVAAKPASKAVKVRPLKALKEMV